MSDEIKELLKGIDKKTFRRVSRPRQQLIKFFLSVYDSDSAENSINNTERSNTSEKNSRIDPRGR